MLLLLLLLFLLLLLRRLHLSLHLHLTFGHGDLRRGRGIKGGGHKGGTSDFRRDRKGRSDSIRGEPLLFVAEMA